MHDRNISVNFLSKINQLKKSLKKVVAIIIIAAILANMVIIYDIDGIDKKATADPPEPIT